MEATAGGISLHDPQEFLSRHDLWKAVFFCHEFPRVHAPPASTQLNGMLQMQHLVVDDVLHDVARHAPVVKHPADDDGIVRGIVMPKAIEGIFAAPGKLRTSHQSVEKSPVEIVENFLQMIMMAARRVNMFSPSQLTHEPRLRGQFMAADITPIARSLGALEIV